MESRDILVVIENPAAVPQRIAPVAALATRFGARLTGFFASGYPIMASYGDVSGWSQLVDAYMEAQRREAAAAGAAFRQALTQGKLRGEWIFREADETGSAVAEAALYDLVVVGQPNPDAGLTGGIGSGKSTVCSTMRTTSCRGHFDLRATRSCCLAKGSENLAAASISRWRTGSCRALRPHSTSKSNARCRICSWNLPGRS